MRTKFAFVIACAASACIAGRASAVQFPTLAPGYTQEIYTGPLVGGPGMAWTSSNALLTRNGSDILEYSLTQNAVHQGTNIHSTVVTHTISGLSGSGYGMTNGVDGYIYAITGAGLQRFDPNNWLAFAQTMPNSLPGLYSITALPDGRIAYSDSGNNSNVYVYNPITQVNTLIYTTTNSLVDGMVAGPTGNIAITGQTDQTMTILTSTGTVLNSFSTAPHYPDGLAFSDTASSSTVYSNNNDGTISKYVFGPNFTGTPTITDIASGAGDYGDLASVGPDCAFYVSQNENGSLHGATPGVGTHWDNGTTNSENSIVRIGFVGADGQPVCEFYSPIDEHVPEPTTIGLMVLGVLPVIMRRGRSNTNR